MVVFVVTLVAKFLKFLGKVSSFIDVTIALIVVIGFVCITQCVCVCVYEDVGRSSLWQRRKHDGAMYCVIG